MQRLHRVAALLNVPPAEADARVQDLLEDHQSSQRELARLQRQLARMTFERLMETQVHHAAGVPVLAAVVEGATEETLREIADWFRDRVGSGVAALGTVIDGRPRIAVAVSPDLVGRGLRAGDLIRPAAQRVGGGGGGTPTLAQAGGRDATRLAEALALVPKLVTEQVGG